MKALLYPLLIVIALSAVTSCSQKSAKGTDTDKESTESPLQEVTIEMADFTFLDAPDTVASGLTTVRSYNSGVFPHNAVLMRIDDGYTYDDLMQYISEHGHHFPEWVTQVGGPSAPPPNGHSEVILDLAAGNYALICIVPVPANEPHFLKGIRTLHME